MTNPITNQPLALSPFRFDTSPQGEADVAMDQIADPEGKNEAASGWGSNGFDFKDVLDVINPLQHIPIVSSIYRHITGDEIAPAPRAIGGALFGGPVGLLAAVGNNIMESETGADAGETAIAMFTGGGSSDIGTPGAGEQARPSQLADVGVASHPLPPPVVTQKLGNIAPPRIPGTFIPSDASVRAGLFSGKNRPAPGSIAGAGPALQAAPASALDRLIAQSQAATNAGPSGASLGVPTDSENVHQWMLRALGKYETMPKG